MQNIYVVRHGETDYNRNYIFQGKSDIPLNETGIAQADTLLEEIRSQGLKFDRIISSPYRRARQTAFIIADGLDVELVTDPGLRERDLGILEGARADKLNENFPDFWAEHKDLSFYEYDIIPDGETLAQLEERVFSAMDRILDASPEETNILIVTHGFAARMIHKYFGNDIKGYHLKNCQLVSYCATNKETEEVPG